MADRSEKERSQLYRLAGAGLEFFSALAGGLLIGYLLDRWLHTAPVIMLIGIGLGFAAGLFRLIRLSKSK
jgi:F0F1-type ATP synthase assembly protein I